MPSLTTTTSSGYVELLTIAEWRGHLVRVGTDAEDWDKLLICDEHGHNLNVVYDEDGNPTNWLICSRCTGLADNPENPPNPPRHTYDGTQDDPGDMHHDRPSR